MKLSKLIFLFIFEKLNHDYTIYPTYSLKYKNYKLSTLSFHKTERVKELIIYGEHNITEIAWKMGYSSAAQVKLRK
jgi:AraC-like DNA-binding protein